MSNGYNNFKAGASGLPRAPMQNGHYNGRVGVFEQNKRMRPPSATRQASVDSKDGYNPTIYNQKEEGDLRAKLE